MYPEPPPYHPPVAAPDPLLPTAPPAAAPRRNRVLITLGSIVTVGLVGLGAAAIALGGGGASSPEEAVQHRAAAIDDQDVLAAVATAWALGIPVDLIRAGLLRFGEVQSAAAVH